MLVFSFYKSIFFSQTIVANRNISIVDVQKVLKSWLQHTGDRISRNQKEEIQNESVDD